MFGRFIGSTCLLEELNFLTSEEGNYREGTQRRKKETLIPIWGGLIPEIITKIEIKKGKSSRIWNTESL